MQNQPDEVEASAAMPYREQLFELIKHFLHLVLNVSAIRFLREAGFTQVTITGRAGDGGIRSWNSQISARNCKHV